MSVISIDAVQGSATSPPKQRYLNNKNISHALDLSESRTYDSALETLGAYKLTGNFPVDLEIVLKELRVLDKVTFEIKPKSLLSDCRHVEFRPKDNVHMDRFSEIMRRIKDEIGFEPLAPFWVRLFR